MAQDALTFLESSRLRVESFFDRYFASSSSFQRETPGGKGTERASGILRTREAMLYSLQAGGKRLRPALVYGALNAIGSDLERGDAAAAAVEMIHTYSLVHDDLPSMDDDDLRRGRPTCHRKYDEATAILAGDGLLTEAFVTLAHPQTVSLWGADTASKIIYELAVGSGAYGMVGGQAMDLAAEGMKVDQLHLESIHRCKTGALIRAAVRMGSLIGLASRGAPKGIDSPARALEQLTSYAEHLGLAFQVADDVLDETADTQTLGKTAGKDLQSQKATYPALMGLERARSYAQECSEKAVFALAQFDSSAEPLRQLARFTVVRSS